MIKKYFILSLRRISRHKLSAAINVLGLTFGILTCLIIYSLVSYEFSFDNFHPDRDRIYRLVVSMTIPGGTETQTAGMATPLPPALRAQLTGFDAVAGFYVDDSRVIIPVTDGQPRTFASVRGGTQLCHIAFVDPDFVRIFQYQWIAGNPASAFNAPATVVLTEQEGRRYFGSGTPAEWLGRTVIYHDSLTTTVTGIVKDWTGNSDFRMTDLISYATVEHSFMKGILSWDTWNPDAQGIVKLSEKVPAAQMERQFSDFIARNVPMMKGSSIRLSLQPLADHHFNAAYPDSYSVRAHKPTLYALIAIASFILIIACINFINLSTAQAFQRAPEVGVRKALGSNRSGLIGQFLNETFLLVVAAMVLALILTTPVIASLHSFIPDGVHLDLTRPMTIGFILLAIIVTCLLAGWYPARIVSAFRPASVLRGKGAPRFNGKSYLRKSLIVFQFFTGLLFIIATIVVGRQMNYMLNKDLGFNKEAIVTLDLPWRKPAGSRTTLAAEMSRLAGVRSVSLASGPPESSEHSSSYISYGGSLNANVHAGFEQIDANYIPLYGLTILAGRNIFPGDSIREFILNETCAKQLGFRNPSDAIGQLVAGGDEVKGPVVGIARDYHSANYHEAIGPFYLTTGSYPGFQLSMKLSSEDQASGQLKNLLARMEAIWTKVFPDEQFNYRFFDDSIARLYEQDQKTATIVNIAMAVAIFISCMGLLGLAAFTASQRAREIGIRKVLGAGVPHLVSLQSADFIRLVLIATLIAGPVAGWAMHQWLQSFAYRTTIPWWIYIVAGVGAMAIALITISFQAFRAATANPVKSLRAD